MGRAIAGAKRTAQAAGEGAAEPYGITVNALGPSLVETDLTRERMRRNPAFQAASFITGQTLLVDGGTSAH